MAVGLASAADPEASIRVRLYDYAGVSQTTLARAKADASAILHGAGVRVEWTECPLREHDAPKDAACRHPVTPMDLQMRILNRDMAKRSGTTRHSLGYALLADGFDSIAAVFFHRAIDLESSNLATRSNILGAMIAHEIGHLLLEQNHHSETGVLRALWVDEDLKMIAKGRIRFTEEQALVMVSMVSRRIGATRDRQPVPVMSQHSGSEVFRSSSELPQDSAADE